MVISLITEYNTIYSDLTSRRLLTGKRHRNVHFHLLNMKNDERVRVFILVIVHVA